MFYFDITHKDGFENLRTLFPKYKFFKSYSTFAMTSAETIANLIETESQLLPLLDDLIMNVEVEIANLSSDVDNPSDPFVGFERTSMTNRFKTRKSQPSASVLRKQLVTLLRDERRLKKQRIYIADRILISGINLNK